MYGVGLILGAGIYAILSEAVAETGESVVVSFALAAGVATVTGVSYAELADLALLAVFVVVSASLRKLRYDGERGGTAIAPR